MINGPCSVSCVTSWRMYYSHNKGGVKSLWEKRIAQFSGTMENSALAAYPWWMLIDVVGRAKADKSGAKPKL